MTISAIYASQPMLLEKLIAAGKAAADAKYANGDDCPAYAQAIRQIDAITDHLAGLVPPLCRDRRDGSQFQSRVLV